MEIQYEKCAPRENGKDTVWMKETFWNDVDVSYLEVPRQIEDK